MAWRIELDGLVGQESGSTQGNAITITKQASGSCFKIDPLMAAFNAVALMTPDPEARGRSYLRSEALLVL